MTEELGPAERGRNLRVVTATYFIMGLFASMTQVVWQPFVLSLGAPMSTVGLLESIGGTSGILPAAVQPFGGWLSDRLGRKPLTVLGSLTGFLSMGFYVLAGISHDWRWLLAGIALLGASSISRPARDSLIAESSVARGRAMAYSLALTAWVAPGVFGPTLGGFVATRWGYASVYIVRLALEGACLALFLSLLRETLVGPRPTYAWRELKGVLMRMFWPPRELRGLYWAMVVDIFAWGIGSSLLFGMLSETRGFTTVQLGIMASLFSAVWALTQLPVGRLVSRYGSKPFLVLSEALGVLLLVGWLFSRSFAAFAALHAYFGFTAALWVPAQLTLFAASVPASERGEALGRLAAFRGLIAFPAPYLGGLLFDRLGFSAPIMANLVGAVLAVIALLFLVKEPTVEEAPAPS